MQTDPRPIFIGGLDRCGKTTLRAFLVSHPNISIPAVGSNMWTYFYGQFGDLGKPENFERCLQALLEYKHVRFLQPNADEIRREFRQGLPTYERLFGIILEQHARREGKPRWGEQTGLIERYADIVLKAYPEGRMIHMLRDPRDRYVASLKMWPNGRGRAGGATARWLYTTTLARRNLKKYPRQYKVVRFEDLVREPEATLQDICQFIGEEYVADMPAMSGAPEHRAKMLREVEYGTRISPLSQAHIGLYRLNLPKPELAFMQSISGASLREFGYEVDPVRFPPAAALEYAFLRWPSNFVRFATWLGIELFQHNYPETFGRKPAQNMVIRDTAGGA
ncbi:MAG: sulfotransferase [Chloroflexi bacterium]|nr:sulfotransferase [Chloroflexota bacterium]